MLAVRTKRHRPLAGEPRCELLVRLHEAVVANAHQDGAEFVEDVVGTVGLSRDFRVQPDQSIAEVILDQDFVQLSREILGSEVVPAETRDLAMYASKPGADRGVMHDAPAEAIANEGFDRVGLIEHGYAG